MPSPKVIQKIVLAQLNILILLYASNAAVEYRENSVISYLKSQISKFLDAKVFPSILKIDVLVSLKSHEYGIEIDKNRICMFDVYYVILKK